MTDRLLDPDDPPPVRVVNPDGRAPVLLACDHASDAMPRRLGTLGLVPRDLQCHIAYDIGAAEVGAILARCFDAPLLLSGFSRLVIDCNRAPGSPTSIPPVSDGTVIPGNQDLAPAAAQARIAEIFQPYHAALGAQLDRLAARAPAACILSVHSCTPMLAGFRRPWQIGVLWNRDGRIAEPLMAALARDGTLSVGDNQPYSGRDGHGYTLPTHAEPRGLPHVLIEIRQDLISDPAGVVRWADILVEAFAPIVESLTGWRVPSA